MVAGLVLAVCATQSASAQTVTLNGSMGDKALLVIDGQPRTVAVGSSVLGVKLVSMDGRAAVIEADGQRRTLVHGAPVSMGQRDGPSSGREIVLTAGPGGHFLGTGSINGRSMRFMVDTGATVVAMSAAEAQRLGVDYRSGERGWVQTANGNAPAYRVTLNAIRIGDVEVHQVAGVVTPAPMDHILLGNSFLTRFQMTRENDVLRLQKR